MTIHREGKLDSRMYVTNSFWQSKSKKECKERYRIISKTLFEV